MAVTASELDERIRAVRRFNRFYTPRIGLLHEGYLGSSFSLTQVRVLYELAHRDRTTASELARDLALDPGYLSRILRQFTDLGLVEQSAPKTDARRRHLSLTERGREVFAGLDRASADGVGQMLTRLSPNDQERLVAAIGTVEHVLGNGKPEAVEVALRSPEPGELGWVVQRHGALYAEEYGWDETFEGLVAEIVGSFGRQHDPSRERCWIAEVDGEPAGSVFCVRKSDDLAQLRLLLVEPWARGRGVGRRLVDDCVDFARTAGYRTMMLWTNDVLVAARRIYEAAGFRLVEEEQHHSFEHDLVGQNWELDLTS